MKRPGSGLFGVCDQEERFQVCGHVGEGLVWVRHREILQGVLEGGFV